MEGFATKTWHGSLGVEGPLSHMRARQPQEWRGVGLPLAVTTNCVSLRAHRHCWGSRQPLRGSPPHSAGQRGRHGLGQAVEGCQVLPKGGCHPAVGVWVSMGATKPVPWASRAIAMRTISGGVCHSVLDVGGKCHMRPPSHRHRSRDWESIATNRIPRGVATELGMPPTVLATGGDAL